MNSAAAKAAWERLHGFSHLVKSMQKLATYDFEWVLPGHGRRYYADCMMMRDQMQQCIRWMASV
jgi:hypothetical protein